MLEELLTAIKALTRKLEPPIKISISGATGGNMASPGFRWILESIEISRDTGSATTSEDLTITLTRGVVGNIVLVRENVSVMPATMVHEFGGLKYTYEPGDRLAIACPNTESCTYTIIIKISRA
jgi:hypothetical protein